MRLPRTGCTRNLGYGIELCRRAPAASKYRLEQAAAGCLAQAPHTRLTPQAEQAAVVRTSKPLLELGGRAGEGGPIKRGWGIQWPGQRVCGSPQ